MNRLTVAALVLGSMVCAACGSGRPVVSRRTTAVASRPARVAKRRSSDRRPGTVVMRNIAFNPQTIHAKVGETITWFNRDDAPHNVTYVSGPRFTSSATFTNGGSFRLKLTKAGTIRYECTIHPGMNGTIVVAP